MEKSRVKTYTRLILSIVVCQIAGIIGSFLTTPAIPTWYARLRKPDFAPPNWVFVPVWMLLYLLMGISLFILWNAGLEKSNVRKSVAIFSVQLVLNIFWSYFFFGLQSPLLGLVEIIALWVAIVLTIVFSFRVSKVAASLLIPYLLWVSFASYLNYLVMILNP